MNDYLRESLSYFGLYRKMFQVRKKYKPVKVSYGEHKEQYFLYYEPKKNISDKIIVWVHGGGWNAGSPKFIQSKHDGLIEYACAEDFAERAKELGNTHELYSVTDKKNTHSWYTAGMFLETREENRGLDKFFSWIEEQ